MRVEAGHPNAIGIVAARTNFMLAGANYPAVPLLTGKRPFSHELGRSVLLTMPAPIGI